MKVKCKVCGKDMMLAAVSSKSPGSSAVSDDLNMYIASCIKCGRTEEITIGDIKIMKGKDMHK